MGIPTRQITPEVRWCLEREALRFYHDHLGKLIEVEWLGGYNREENGDCFQCRAIVRVVHTSARDLLHWCDEWLDPYWNVELVSGDDQARSLRSIWIDGPSINALTGEYQWKHVRVLGWWESLKARIFG